MTESRNISQHDLALITLAARTAHEVNRAYCRGLGDTSQLAWEDVPEWQREFALEGARRIFLYPNTSPKDSHEGWLSLKQKEGWKYGPVKDVDKREHPCFVPYEDLPPKQRIKDILFWATVYGVLSALTEPEQNF